MRGEQKMSWVFYGLMASLIFGAYAIPLKYLSGRKYLDASLGTAMISMAFGLLIGYLLLAVLSKAEIRGDLANPKIWVAGLVIGLLHATGIFFVLTGLKMPDVNIAQMVSVFNTNTLVSFILAIIVFKELPNSGDLLRCFVGAVLIVCGAVLVSK
jgi:drug/metabolite transporter (DMT)-like permease